MALFLIQIEVIGGIFLNVRVATYFMMKFIGRTCNVYLCYCIDLVINFILPKLKLLAAFVQCPCDKVFQYGIHR